MGDVRNSAQTGLEALTLPSEPAIAVASAVGSATRLSLRVRDADAELVGRALSVDLSGRINTATTSGSCSALRLGPDEWLLLAEGEMPRLPDVLSGGIAPKAYAVVDVSDRFVAIEIAGSAVEDVLAAGCPLPLDATSFPIGRATRTLYAKAEIVLWRRGEDRFRIEIGRSFAPYLLGLLATVIRDEAAIGRQAAR